MGLFIGKLWLLVRVKRLAAHHRDPPWTSLSLLGLESAGSEGPRLLSQLPLTGRRVGLLPDTSVRKPLTERQMLVLFS